jgi:hypothetical protein
MLMFIFRWIVFVIKLPRATFVERLTTNQQDSAMHVTDWRSYLT